MKRIAVSELTGAALDYFVASSLDRGDLCAQIEDRPISYTFRPSQSWGDGGPIVERENMTIEGATTERGWLANIGMSCEQEGPSPLVAAMRCFVASQWGEFVDVPEGLARTVANARTCAKIC